MEKSKRYIKMQNVKVIASPSKARAWQSDVIVARDFIPKQSP
jgi:hypothetical protein